MAKSLSINDYRMKGRGVIKVAYWGYFLGITEVAWNLHQILRHICKRILIVNKNDMKSVQCLQQQKKEKFRNTSKGIVDILSI